MRTNNIHVSIVSGAVEGTRAAVRVGEEGGGEVSDERKRHEHRGACDPSQLRYGPRQRQHP